MPKDVSTRPRKDKSGTKPHKLLLLYQIITPTGVGNANRVEYMCRCDCGKEKIIMACHVHRTKSCGCTNPSKRNHKHGHSARGKWSPTYRVWTSMKGRCLYKSHEAYDRYGGSGITICDRWRKFENFLSDMGESPSPKHSIDRIDNKQGYSPENCRWATMKEQQRNKRNNRIISAFGQDKPVCAWAEEYGIYYGTILYRIRVCGWDAERAITTPPVNKGQAGYGKKTTP